MPAPLWELLDRGTEYLADRLAKTGRKLPLPTDAVVSTLLQYALLHLQEDILLYVRQQDLQGVAATIRGVGREYEPFAKAILEPGPEGHP